MNFLEWSLSVSHFHLGYLSFFSFINMGEFSGGPPRCPGTGAFALWGEVERAGLVQPGEKIVLSGSNSSPPAGEDLIKKTLWRGQKKSLYIGTWWKDEK